MSWKIINLKSLLFLLYSTVLILLPYYSYNSFGDATAILPASDICILYYLCSYKHLNNLQLFVIGTLMDSVIGIPIGISAFALMSANIVLRYLGNFFAIKNYLTNITIFIIYCCYIIFSRYALIGLFTDYEIDIIAVFFWGISTIASYPIWHYLMKFPDYLFSKKTADISYS